MFQCFIYFTQYLNADKSAQAISLVETSFYFFLLLYINWNLKALKKENNMSKNTVVGNTEKFDFLGKCK